MRSPRATFIGGVEVSWRSRRSLGDISVGAKITAVVVLCITVAAVVLSVGLVGLAGVRDRAVDTYQNSTLPSADLAGIRAATLEAQRDLANYALATDDVARADLDTRIQADDATVDALVGQFAQRPLAARQQAVLREFVIWWSAYRDVRRDFLVPSRQRQECQAAS